jgi:hypothetical protein
MMKTQIIKKQLFIACLLFLTLVTACKKEGENNPPTGNATFAVKMGDSPAGYDAVYVEIIRLEANINGAWLEYPVVNPGVYDLMQFTNGNTLLLLGNTSVAPGSMTELRLVLGVNNSVVVNGTTHELQTPSGQTSGYKVKMSSQLLSPGIVYSLILDFDVNESVHPTGNDKYMLKPVVRGYLETAIGKISCTVVPANGAFYVMAFNAVDTAGTYIDQTNGTLLLNTVLPGTYNVEFFANTGFVDKVISNVIVTAGQTNNMGNVTIDPVKQFINP